MEDRVVGNNTHRKFFILVPVYKVEKYVKECIESVLNQDYSNFTMILVDDGSPDSSGSICDRYAEQDDRIHVIHKRNGGLISARQAAREYLFRNLDRRNSFTIYLDSDDSLKHNALSTINDIIDTYQCDMVIYGFDRVIDGKIITQYNQKNEFFGCVLDRRELYHIVLEDNMYNALWRKAISSDLLQNIDYSEYFGISHGEDLLQSLPYYAKAKKTMFITDHLYNYSVNPNSITESVDKKSFQLNTVVRNITLCQLECEKIWTREDYNRYFSFCKKQLKKEIILVSNLEVSDKEKELYLDQISHDPYYHKILSQRDVLDVLLVLLAKKKYKCLLEFLRIRRFALSLIGR